VPRSVHPWLVIVPLATAGGLGGHRIAYALAGPDHDALHGYLAHAPQLGLLLLVLALVFASFVDRGARLALWPFPTVTLTGFVVQEHVERVAHDGSAPFLLGERVFLVGLVVQVVVAVAAWLVARLLVRAVGSFGAACAVRIRGAASWPTPPGSTISRPRGSAANAPRAPPLVVV
jgi:hypothetical protein